MSYLQASCNIKAGVLLIGGMLAALTFEPQYIGAAYVLLAGSVFFLGLGIIAAYTEGR